MYTVHQVSSPLVQFVHPFLTELSSIKFLQYWRNFLFYVPKGKNKVLNFPSVTHQNIPKLKLLHDLITRV